ncbi:phosphodiester glycosidase family protein [Propionicimonas sp.]|uniref:phosphodiester glycosidase family protein n=1 Tax=Propionicimonas sp. TaxID=1955623 RepID=UPI001D7242F8|nr:phosphodiester glycosidase family protein [Propionicimonas sp.]MBU3975363.1 phosphodiester glycosidase family protein [Actinomycetota bacterium]MBU3986488.1 phosphodiester glycosidase family protein [Actinomycetota bacterium]MBU4008057.1 phosphodiester glycosidase family protein [Actinomycetota bacterium]MBU4064315.1 phosphodiester glycosidase family protein [Actinomycetota bacterium]MBU4092747.1 phosphodiester glycosidase family protein [Actinomycetota bacterium]
MDLNDGGDAVINDLETQQIAPGLLHVSYERLDAAGWQQIDVLKAELSDQTVKMKYLSPETVSGEGTTVTDLVDRNSAIAGVNLDRFDINNSYAASGWGVSGGKILKSGNDDAHASVGVNSSGLGALVDLALEGLVTLPDGQSLSIDGINAEGVDGSGVVLYNSHWGSYTRDRLFSKAGRAGVEVWVDADGIVTSGPRPTAGDDGPIAAGAQVLAAFADRAGGAALQALSVGEKVGISYGIKDSVDVAEAGGAWQRLIRDGQVVPYPNEAYYTGVNPRTMIGFGKDRSTAYFVVVDGRQGNAKGMAFDQQQNLMGDLGAWDAINADGGGSSQMNTRHPGETNTTVENSPSDGYERSDGDGMGLVLAQPSSGELLSFAVTSVLADDDALRLFPGTHRTLRAAGYDEAGSPVAGVPTLWRSDEAKIATITDGVVEGKSSGEAALTARKGVASGRAAIEVLGKLTRLEVGQNVVNLEKQGSSQVLSFAGYDADGFRAPVEAGDLKIENSNPAVFEVKVTEDGRINVTAVGANGTAVLRFSHAGHTAEVSVAVPLEIKTIDDFHDISGWKAANDRAPDCNIEDGEGHDGAPSIRLNYDFTKSTATRGCYAVAPGAVQGTLSGIDIPGRPQKLSVWIKGDTKGALLRLQVMQANGVTNWIDGPGGSQSLHATWDGWERVDFAVPSTFAFPLKFQRIRALETVAAKQYVGSLEFSQIFAYLPPEGTAAPAVAEFEDPTLTETGSTANSPLRVAVMSDAQFVARDPESGAVAGARDALREIVAAKPDVLLIDGDFVDEASTADISFAKSILDEELANATFPWYYVPGNHEVMGGPISNFKAAFGETNRTFALKNTRFIGLDSSAGKLQSDFDQVKLLRKQLDEAASDPSTTGVVVFTHMPIYDPLATKGSQLTDRVEAEMLKDWMTEFREESGKSIAVVNGHVGVFHTSSVDGVPMIINGNSGKSPASTVADGGFTGWTMLGIDPAQGRWADADQRWISDEVKTRVDSLALTAPVATLTPGQLVELNPVVTQDGSRQVPVEWPVSYQWSSSAEVFIGDASDAPSTAVVAINPKTSVLTALRHGAGSATLAVNDATTKLEVSVGDSSVEVAGTAATGQRLTASVGAWAEGATLAYQWRLDGVPVEGATAATYEVVGTDVGHQVDVAVTVSGTGRASVTVVAAPTDSLVKAGTQADTKVTVSGKAMVGSTLEAVGDWPDGVLRIYQWLRSGQVIAGAVSSQYNLANADQGHQIAVRVTGTRVGYVDTVTTSAATAVVERASRPEDSEPVPPTVGAGRVELAGSARVGGVLKALPRGWERGATLVYQWYRSGVAIPGATNPSYRAVAADQNKKLQVRVIASVVNKVSVARFSIAKRVAAGVLKPGKVTVRGWAISGWELRAQVRGGSSGAMLSYQWLSRGRIIGTASTLRVPSSARRSKIVLKVTFTKPGYGQVTRTRSSATVR